MELAPVITVFATVPSTASTDAAETVRCRFDSRRKGVNIFDPGLFLPVAGALVDNASGGPLRRPLGTAASAFCARLRSLRASSSCCIILDDIGADDGLADNEWDVERFGGWVVEGFADEGYEG